MTTYDGKRRKRTRKRAIGCRSIGCQERREGRNARRRELNRMMLMFEEVISEENNRLFGITEKTRASSEKILISRPR